MAYTRPSASVADATFLGALAYTRPSPATADAAWLAESYTGVGLGALDFTGSALAYFGVMAIDGVAAGTLDLSGGGVATHGATGAGAGVLGFTGGAVAQHLRYEVRGEVRLMGVLVNRTVRCYARTTGALLGQSDTVAGKYRVHAGFTDAEVYTLAIHLDGGATDWIPPAANRLVPALADDTA